ncbi:hypothetical protein [Nonomuraea dietziae]|uniref:hypothetical protein n=1 Tax=Nonomuraea dietziae TaxID=65515 RepID=UPI0031E3150A
MPRKRSWPEGGHPPRRRRQGIQGRRRRRLRGMPDAGPAASGGFLPRPSRTKLAGPTFQEWCSTRNH